MRNLPDKMLMHFLDEWFQIHEYHDSYQLETWTAGGVDMLIDLHKQSKESLEEQFISYVRDFDVDEEIRVHMEAEDYQKAFSFRAALEDFEAHERLLEEISDQLQKEDIFERYQTEYALLRHWASVGYNKILLRSNHIYAFDGSKVSPTQLFYTDEKVFTGFLDLKSFNLLDLTTFTIENHMYSVIDLLNEYEVIFEDIDE